MGGRKMGSRETEVWVIGKAGQYGWAPDSRQEPEEKSGPGIGRLPGKNCICAKHQLLPFTEPPFWF